MNTAKIDTGTGLYGVIGSPVSHSLSPLMQNAAFSAENHNGVYLAFDVTDVEATIGAVRTLGIGGLSVTIPHKVPVMAFLDGIDPLAEKIGAVNTVVSRDGKLVGYNTDCMGAMRALLEKTAVKDKNVVIAGAGGAARAIGFGVISEGGNLTVVNRGVEKGEKLARELGADFAPLDDLDRSPCDIFINSTSLGMVPNIETTPLAKDALHAGMVVMDIVYNPLETRLLKDAAEMGAVPVDGLSMFVYQGACQFELWTGKPAPVKLMRDVVLTKLTAL